MTVYHLLNRPSYWSVWQTDNRKVIPMCQLPYLRATMKTLWSILRFLLALMATTATTKPKELKKGFHITDLGMNTQHIQSFKISFQFLACATWNTALSIKARGQVNNLKIIFKSYLEIPANNNQSHTLYKSCLRKVCQIRNSRTYRLPKMGQNFKIRRDITF